MIRQPNVILGNSELLVTMGCKGEIFGFFYPRRDYAQHVEDSTACIYFDGKLSWLNGIEWASKQQYMGNTNIVVTKLTHHGIHVTITDFVLPDAPVLIRRFSIRTKTSLKGKFYYYSKFNVGEMLNKNSNFCDREQRLLVQYWQNHYIGIKGEPPFDEWQVGKAMDTIWWTNAKIDMEDGRLQNNIEDIGNLNLTAGWDIELDAGGVKEITVYIGASNKRSLIYKFLHNTSEHPVYDLLKKTKGHWIEWLKNNRIGKDFSFSHNKFLNKFKRSLLILNLLNEQDEGSFIAAPEFDHGFENCGGYGFCWNRDSTKMVLSLSDAGYPEYAKQFFKWCKKAQMSDGSWFQRYWLNGDKAPSWGNFMHSTQMDETGITLYAINRYIKTLTGIQRDLFLDDVWLCILQAAEYLMKRTGEGLHEPCMDLWETCYGTFTYTNASIYGGLSAAADIALMRHEHGLSTRWLNRSEYIKQQTIDRLWLDEGYFAKAIMNDVVDVTADASILGTITPFKLLTPKKEQEREMIKSIIKALEQKLAVKVNGYQGICRYENDHYIGGNPWIVSTLWLSKALLYLAAYEPDAKNKYIEHALKYICWSLEGTTGPGLFPEQVDKNTGRPAWAIPLGWSHSLFIDNILLLDALEKHHVNMQGKGPCG